MTEGETKTWLDDEVTQRDDEIGRRWRPIRRGCTLQGIGERDVERQLDPLREQREFKIEVDRIRGDIVGGDILDQKRFMAA
jgi:hypothetical protein